MVKIEEVKAVNLNADHFIEEKVGEIASTIGKGEAINALSGGVDSSSVTMLGHKAIGNNLKTYFIDNGIMREGEPQRIVDLFKGMGVRVQVHDAREKFFKALKGITDPEEKREAITQTFYKDVFGELVKESETVAGIKRQHNVFEQMGINPEKTFGYRIIEPLIQLRKDGVRKVAQALGLPDSVFNRIPFPGPALSARVIGEVTEEKIEKVRIATRIVEEELFSSGAFQYMAILHQDRVTGIRDGKRDFGLQIEIRCWDSVDAREAHPTRLSHDTLVKLANRMVSEVPGVVSVTYNIASKPPSTMEVI
jgi:GMP synthase (glutamine-hydrolysing)